LSSPIHWHWVAEGQPLTEEDPGISELVVTPKKLTALVSISREMASDAINPGAAAIVGQGVVTQIQRQIDSSYFGSNVGHPNQPAGLEDLVGYQSVTIGGQFEDLTWAVQAETLLNQVGAIATAFVASANTVSILARLKEFQPTATVISNETLLQADPTQRTKYQINGTPLYWTLESVIPDGTIWARCATGANPKAFVVQRQDVELITSPWPFFTNDCLALRATLRYAYAWPHPQAVVKIVGVMPGS
jgi:HK97 family phage major capsid protein